MSSDTLQPQRSSLRAALAERVVIGDGAMGSMLQRPDVVRNVHEGYLAAGCDCISTNTRDAMGIGGADPAELDEILRT